MANASNRSLASSRRRCVSPMLRDSTCAERVYITPPSSRTTMLNTTASSVSVKPRWRDSGRDADKAVIKGALRRIAAGDTRAARALLLEIIVEIDVGGRVEKVVERTSRAAGVFHATARERKYGALVVERGTDVEGHAQTVRCAGAVARPSRRIGRRHGGIGEAVPVVRGKPVPVVGGGGVQRLLLEDCDRSSVDVIAGLA